MKTMSLDCRWWLAVFLSRKEDVSRTDDRPLSDGRLRVPRQPSYPGHRILSLKETVYRGAGEVRAGKV